MCSAKTAEEQCIVQFGVLSAPSSLHHIPLSFEKRTFWPVRFRNSRHFDGASNSERNAGPVAKLGRGQQGEHKFCCGLQSETFGYSLYMVSSLYKLNKMSAECGGRSLCFCLISGTNKGIDDEYYSLLIWRRIVWWKFISFFNLKGKSVPPLKRPYFVPDYTASHPKDSNI
jgi:hypothetical protein